MTREKLERIVISISITMFLSSISYAHAKTPRAEEECSTEKVNNDCTLTIDRSYPLTLPTLQIRSGKKVTVNVIHPLPFETLTLDPQSAQLVPGTDQLAGLITAAIPDLKGLIGISTSTFRAGIPFRPGLLEDQAEVTVRDDLEMLDKKLKDATDEIDSLLYKLTIIYSQLKEILSPLPRPLGVRAPSVPEDTPNPWNDYRRWRIVLLCELAGGEDCLATRFSDVLGQTARLQRRLPGASQQDSLLFDSRNFDIAVNQTREDIQKLPAGERNEYTEELNRRVGEEVRLNTSLMSLASTILPNLLKDLQGYLGNISLATGSLNRPDILPLGVIYDPREAGSAAYNFLGRQVAFSVNAVNQIFSFVAVPTASQKTSLQTITVLYADPIFEVSAGAFFSTLPNRSLANQTAVSQNPGSSPSLGNISIGRTVSHPEIIPFVGAHWRLGHDFTWPGGRRGAVYATLLIGLNPYNTLPEFGGGFSLSWRSVLFSPIFHLGHDIHLTQGEYVGQVWCNASATAGAMPPPCSPAPPNPSTKTYWTHAYGLAISVRVPTVFTAGSGGVSR